MTRFQTTWTWRRRREYVQRQNIGTSYPLECWLLFYRYIPCAISTFLLTLPGYNLLNIECTISFLFWLASSLQWIFKSVSVTQSSCRLYNNHVKGTMVTGNHVVYDCGAWFLTVIMSSPHFMLLAISEEAKTWILFLPSKCNKRIRFGFCAHDIQNNQGLRKGYQPQPWASANNPYLNLDYSGHHENINQ